MNNSCVKVISVVAAVIFGEGRVFICRRPRGKHLAGKWEFPGGKPEEGESPEEALARECREELGIEVAVGRAIGFAEHDYGDRKVNITFFACTCGDEPRALEHDAVAWVSAEELLSYDLCPADRDFVTRLAASPELFG